MPSTVFEVTDTVSIEFLLGLAFSKNGTKIDINDVQAIKITPKYMGATILIRMKWRMGPDVIVALNEKDLDMMKRFESVSVADTLKSFTKTKKEVVDKLNTEFNGTEKVTEDNLFEVVRHLKAASHKVDDLLEDNFVTGVSYETRSDTNTLSSPMWRTVVTHTPKKKNSLIKTAIYKTTIYLDNESYVTMVDLNGGTMPVPDKKPQPIHKVECSVSAEKIPRLLPTKYYDADTLKKFPESTFVMKCKCEKGFFCPNIMASVDKGLDFRSWITMVDAPNKNVPTHFYLAVPMYGSILYSFRVRFFLTEDWAGKKQGKLLAFGISEDETFFYDVPRQSVAGASEPLTIMRDMITYVNQVYKSIEETWTPLIYAIAYKGYKIPCAAKSHNYGTNSKVIEAMRNSVPHDDFMKSFTLSMELYNLCNFCYINANPAFSLVPDLF